MADSQSSFGQAALWAYKCSTMIFLKSQITLVEIMLYL